MVNVTRLKELMVAQNLTIEELAVKSGVSHSAIASIRSGRRPNTSSEIVTKLAAALCVSPNELLRGIETATENELPALIRQLIDRAITLSEIRQEELVRIADALKVIDDEESHSPFTREKMLRFLQAVRNLSEDEVAILIQQIRAQRGDTSGGQLTDGSDAP